MANVLWCVLACANASAALASTSCGDQVAEVDKRLDAIGATSSKANSAGQAVAAERGAHARSGDPAQDPEASSGATPKKDATGGAGDAFMAAKVAVNDARNADRKGDVQGCEAALNKAKTLGHL